MIHFTPLDWFWAGAFLLLMVGGALFFFRRQPDFVFDVRIGDNDKMPGLLVGTAGSASGRFQAAHNHV